MSNIARSIPSEVATWQQREFAALTRNIEIVIEAGDKKGFFPNINEFAVGKVDIYHMAVEFGDGTATSIESGNKLLTRTQAIGGEITVSEGSNKIYNSYPLVGLDIDGKSKSGQNLLISGYSNDQSFVHLATTVSAKTTVKLTLSYNWK